LVNSQSKFHSWIDVDFTMKKRKENRGKKRKKGKK